jgi:hypothetical protein
MWNIWDKLRNWVHPDSSDEVDNWNYPGIWHKGTEWDEAYVSDYRDKSDIPDYEPYPDLWVNPDI